MMSLREKETLYTTKQEEGTSAKASGTAASSSRQWSSGLKNPRIVRVSRSFGGKDRHSKVCTIKGLRDRRIRLSVPTAIQLYDLQDRLGLSQPSKVIDWLLETTKDDIDKLPPLPVMPGSFSPFNQATHSSHGYGAHLSSSPFFDASLLPSRREAININSESVDVDEEDQSLEAKLKYWDPNAIMRSKQKGIDDQGTLGDHSAPSNSQVSAQNFFPIASSTSSILQPSTLLSNNPMLSYYHSEPSHLSLTQLGSLGLPSQHDHHQGTLSSSGPLPSSLALSSGSQFFLCPSMATSSLFPQYASFVNTHQQVENDMRQLGRFQLSNPFSSSLHNSSGLGLKPFPLSMSHQPHHLQQSDENHQDKTDHSHWKESSRN